MKIEVTASYRRRMREGMDSSNLPTTVEELGQLHAQTKQNDKHATEQEPDPSACAHCGVSHVGFLSCFHYRVTACLMRAHTRLRGELSPDADDVGERQSDSIEKEEDESPHPTLKSILRLDHSDAEAILLSQRHAEMPEVSDRMASLILMYRLLKWRLHPTASKLANVPPFYRPTPTQLIIPHPVNIDFFAFPALRDALIQDERLYLNTEAASRELFELDFIENLTVQWPPLEPLVVRASFLTPMMQGGGARFKLNPAFEAHLLDFSNWAMHDAWMAKYPHLADCVNRCRPSFAMRRRI